MITIGFIGFQLNETKKPVIPGKAVAIFRTQMTGELKM
jgi:hypothetical protein